MTDPGRRYPPPPPQKMIGSSGPPTGLALPMLLVCTNSITALLVIALTR